VLVLLDRVRQYDDREPERERQHAAEDPVLVERRREEQARLDQPVMHAVEEDAARVLRPLQARELAVDLVEQEREVEDEEPEHVKRRVRGDEQRRARDARQHHRVGGVVRLHSERERKSGHVNREPAVDPVPPGIDVLAGLGDAALRDEIHRKSPSS
jgi:hypothetical protein